MSYVDGFVAAVPTENKKAFLEHASAAAKVFKEYGALSVVECWGDNVLDGELTSFPKAVQCKENESIIFSWIVWRSREVRDQAWEKIRKDDRMSDENNPMPFDGKRMIYGGFQAILET